MIDKSLEDRLFDTSQRHAGASSVALSYYDNEVVGVIGKSDDIAHIIRWMESVGFRCSERQLHDNLSGTAPIILVLQDGESLAEVAESLFYLRARHPSVPLILVGRNLSRDDLETDRIHLYDAALKIPVSVPRFELALCQAAITNHFWQHRLERLRPTHSKVRA